MRFRYVLAVGAATALAGLGATAAPAAAARGVPLMSGARPAIAHKIRPSILAGYAVEKATSLTSATTTFKIPALTCPAAANNFVNENFEIGAPSSTPDTVAKGLAVTFVGTCHGSAAAYLGIVAFPPSKRIKELSGKVAAGDNITISITASTSSGAATVTIAGHKQTLTSPGFAATFALADVIVDPAVAHTGPKWTRVRFTDTKLDNKSLGSFSPTRIDAATVTKQVLAVPSKLRDGGTEFVVRYRA